MKDAANNWGARMERGCVDAADDSGGIALYTVSSYDRPGVTGYGLWALNEAEYEAGDQVYFVLFNDGTGFIVAGLVPQ